MALSNLPVFNMIHERNELKHINNMACSVESRYNNRTTDQVIQLDM